MSLNQNELENNLISIFRNMTDGDDGYFAREVSAAIAGYAESGVVATTDAGAISQGAFVGSGNGSASVDPSICESIVLAACKAMAKMTAGGDDYLASQLAVGIDSMMSAGTVNTSVKGTVTPPNGTAFTTAGTAKGTFTGVMTTLQSGFSAAFNAMAGMTSGGDEYLARQMATVITAYLKAGIIAAQGQANLEGSIGAGSMS